jgi:beta-N-acetylhexosaminidase
MKKLSQKFLFYFLILFLICNCATKKDTTNAIVSKTVVSNQVVVQNIKLETTTTPTIVLEDFNTNEEKKWVDSTFNAMNFDEKLGQLFMVAAWSNKDTIHTHAIERLVNEQKIGGLIFFQGGPQRQAKFSNHYQSIAKIPLFIGNDAEWGLSMRLDSTYRYPWNMTLGAIQDMNLIEKLGAKMAKECKRMNIHFNFAPVIDINTNPRNPIIGFRSFGEDKFKVTEHAVALMKGFKSENIFSTGKHFPGHGDSETDSHKGLPIINFSKERINDIELYPYKEMFKAGMESVMVAHLNVPSLESRPNYPSSISYNVVTNILQKELGFKGLIFTDALNMKGASNFKNPGDIDLEAFLAGNDILLFPENVPVAIEKFKQAYIDTLITKERIEFSVKKILKYKFRAGLNHYKPIVTENLEKDLSSSSNDALTYELLENAVTVLKNKDEILPIKNLEKNKIAYVRLGDFPYSTFLTTLKKYTDVSEVEDENIDSLNVKLKNFDTVILGFHKSDLRFGKYDFSDFELELIKKVAENNKVILDVFTKPYSLLQITDFENIEGLVVSYQNSDIAQEVSAELLFGAIESKGKLPVSINTFFKVNDGLATQKMNRLGFSAPENVGMNPEILNKIDGIANKAINRKMAPGMQVLVARKGKVIYQKSFGYQTYDNIDKIVNSNIYDVASITKMVATLPNVMQMYDQKKINLDSKLGDMVPVFQNTDKTDITFKSLLSHYARFQAWIPFYIKTLDANKQPMEKYYRKVSEENFSKKVAENLYIRNDFHDSIMKIIANSKLIPKLEYKYSDFTFIIMKEFLEKTSGKSLDILVKENFYNSMGMTNTTYNPLEKFDKKTIAPTEIDTYFRYQTLQGNVHDMGAAMQGGIGGHAGLFSNSMDIAKMMQLYLQKGNYGNQQYFSEKTFDDFNTCYFLSEGNRRALGFDKPQLGKETGPTCKCVSKSSFGHTGFTGTMTWADPETEIVYVFLSNRTFPDGNAPNLLSKNSIREDIQKIIQDAIIK